MNDSTHPRLAAHRELLEGIRTIAVVGASDDPSKAAHAIPRLLVEAGYDVIPVNPNRDEVFGLPAYPRLADVPRHVDLVNVFRPAAFAPGIARESVAIGADAFWLQLDLRSPEARAICEDAGLAYVEDECLGVVVRVLGVHPRPLPED